MHPPDPETDPLAELRLGMSLARPVETPEGLRGWLASLLPHAWVTPGNPMFAYALRGVQREYSRRYLLRGLALGLLRDAVFAIIIWSIAYLTNSATLPVERADRQWLLLGLALVIGLLAGYVLDAFCVFITAFSHRREAESGIEDDLLRLSHIDTVGLVRARFAAGQIRVWNFMRTVMGLRLLVLVFAVLNTFVMPQLAGQISLRDYAELRFGAAFGFAPGPLTELLAVLAVLALAALLLIEPLWRMRALVAGGLAAAAGRASTTSVMFYGAGVLVGVWMIQFTLLIVTGIILFVIAGSPTCLALGLPVAVLAGGGGLRMLYMGVTISWLQRAYRHALVEGG